MPLRDHFRPPVTDRHTWDSFHGGWPMMIVRQLFDVLPAGYVAAPNVHFGKDFEIDISAFERDEPAEGLGARSAGGAAAAAAAAAAAPAPTLTLEADLSDQDEFSVRIYDTEYGRRLVAAIEIVSPSNKDRRENRRAFAAKVAALLQKGVCVSVVDLVSVRQANLYAELLELIGGEDPELGESPANLYSVTIRSRQRAERRSVLDLWYYPMAAGRPLPTLPIWLGDELRVMLELEASYEETCRLLHIA
jgi:hypothetical protein